MPTVSVVIPTRNMARFLVNAIQSVLSQTYQDFEIIVVDGQSTDGTRELVEGYSDARLRLIEQEGTGLAAARNTGIRHSQGTYIALLDADDLWFPEKLQRQVEVLEADVTISLVYCDYQDVNVDGQYRNPSMRFTRTQPTLYEELLYGNVISGSASAMIVRARVLDEVGLFNEQLPACSDLDFFRRLALRHNLHFVDEVLVSIRIHDGQMQKHLEQMTKGVLGNLANIQKEITPEYRHHLPVVARKTYEHLALDYFRARNFRRSAGFIGNILALGPRQMLLACCDLLGYLQKNRRA